MSPNKQRSAQWEHPFGDESSLRINNQVSVDSTAFVGVPIKLVKQLRTIKICDLRRSQKQESFGRQDIDSLPLPAFNNAVL